jgi:hypothetical protein
MMARPSTDPGSVMHLNLAVLLAAAGLLSGLLPGPGAGPARADGPAAAVVAATQAASRPAAQPASSPASHPASRPAVRALPRVALPEGAGSATAAKPVPTPTQAAERLRQRITAEIGEARCSADSQCRVLPIGAKACGGPAGWQAYSTVEGRADRLTVWAAQLERQERTRQAAEGLMSNCAVELPPAVACVAQRCTLVAAGTSAGTGAGGGAVKPPAVR